MNYNFQRSATDPTYSVFLPSSSNVYLCQFPSKWTKAELRPLVEQFGDISEIRICTIANERYQSIESYHGVAFVHYCSPQSAANAVKNLNGMLPQGHTHKLVAKMAEQSKNIPSAGLPTSNVRLLKLLGSKGTNNFVLFSKTSLFVSGYPPFWSKEDVTLRFSAFGALKNVEMDSTKRRIRVEFCSPEPCLKAIACAAENYSLYPVKNELLKELNGRIPKQIYKKRVRSVRGKRKQAIRICFSVFPRSELVRKLGEEGWKGYLSQAENFTRVYVASFPNDWGKDQVATLFCAYGNIRNVFITTKAHTEGVLNLNRGSAFVHFDEEKAAICAVVGLNESIPPGCAQNLLVTFANVNMAEIDK